MPLWRSSLVVTTTKVDQPIITSRYAFSVFYSEVCQMISRQQWNTKLLSKVHVIDRSSKTKDYSTCRNEYICNLHSYVNLDTWNSLNIVPILVSPAIFVIISSWKRNKARKEDYTMYNVHVRARTSSWRCIDRTRNW